MAALQYPAIDQYIAQFEGFGTPGTVATRNNNPGNIICGDFASAHGSTGCEGNFATFPDLATGAGAEDSLVNGYASKGASLSDLISAWSPPNAPGNSPQATQNYIDYVSSKLGVSSDTPVSSLSGIGTPTDNTSLTSSILGSIFDSSPLGLGSKVASAAGFSFARIGSFLLGLILIAGGIYLFKPVQETVSTVARTGRRVAEIAAL